MLALDLSGYYGCMCIAASAVLMVCISISTWFCFFSSIVLNKEDLLRPLSLNLYT